MEQASFSPFFSILIPTYNRPECLATCLESLAHLDYPHSGFEVIVVDDGSTVSLLNIIDTIRCQLNITFIVQTNAGPATARNTAAKQAKGKFLIFTDDDCTLAPNYLKVLAAHFANTPDALIGGRTLNALTDNLYSTSSQTLIDYLYKYYNNGSRLNFFASNNFALPALLFHELSGFDISFPTSAAEDREFCDRWLYHGYKMIYAPCVCVYHSHELNLLSFWQQHFKYGRGAFCYHKVRARRNQEQIQVQPLLFYWNLLLYPISQSLGLQSFLISVLFLVSQLANVAGFVWECKKQSSLLLQGWRWREGSTHQLRRNIPTIPWDNEKSFNTRATLARGKYLVFTDDDCKPTPNWLKNVSVCFATLPNVIIGGYTVNALTNNVYSTATHVLMDYLYQLSKTESQQPNFFASKNFALRADSFSTIGGFDTTFPLAAGEDREFCDRCLHHGYKMVYAPQVCVHHTHELNLQKFWQQHFNYGRGAFRFRQVRARRNLEQIKVEALSFYWNLITYPLSKTLNLQAFLVSGLLFISQVANVLGFFWELNTSSQKSL